MNYLAHALLAEPYAHSIIGNLAGDLVKGPLDRHILHPRTRDGIQRHRRVDVLTDQHPAYRALKREFPSGQRRFAGIILDVLFDYFLCRHWSRFSRWHRGDFIDGVYRVLSSSTDVLPAPLAAVAPRWVEADWLRVYETRQGVSAVLDRLSRRLGDRRGSSVDLAGMLEGRWPDEPLLEQGFLDVFCDVQRALDGVTARGAGHDSVAPVTVDPSSTASVHLIDNLGAPP